MAQEDTLPEQSGGADFKAVDLSYSDSGGAETEPGGLDLQELSRANQVVSNYVTGELDKTASTEADDKVLSEVAITMTGLATQLLAERHVDPHRLGKDGYEAVDGVVGQWVAAAQLLAGGSQLDANAHLETKMAAAGKALGSSGLGDVPAPRRRALELVFAEGAVRIFDEACKAGRVNPDVLPGLEDGELIGAVSGVAQGIEQRTALPA